MKASNNLNQLLSRVKTFSSRKAAPVATAIQTEAPPTNISIVSNPQIKAAFSEVEKYLAENYGTPKAQLRYKDYTNGASLMCEDATFSMSLIILTTAEGLYNLPDNVLLLGHVTSDKGVDWLTDEVSDLIVFLKRLGADHRIQHLALAFSKEKPDHPATVKKPTSPASASTKLQSHPSPRQEDSSCRGDFHYVSQHIPLLCQ